MNSSERTSPFVIALVIGTLALTLLFFFWPEAPVEDTSSKDQVVTTDTSVEETTAIEPLFDDSEEEFEAAFVEALSSESTDESGFLETDYEPLAKWLDERFELEFKNMTPAIIFDQVPLNDIFYDVEGIDDLQSSFNLSSRDMSRRELLQKISTFWDLEMGFAVDESNTPTAVKVSPR